MGGGGGNGWLSSACPNSGVGEKERGEDLAGCPGVQFLKPGAGAAAEGFWGGGGVGSGLIGGRRGGPTRGRSHSVTARPGALLETHCLARRSEESEA